jgi:hypothetical protein
VVFLVSVMLCKIALRSTSRPPARVSGDRLAPAPRRIHHKALAYGAR